MEFTDTFSDCLEDSSFYFLKDKLILLDQEDDIPLKQDIPLFNKVLEHAQVKAILFGFLALEEKKVLRQVSKQWARIIDQELHFNIPPLTDSTLPWIVNCRQKIEKLTIQDFSGPTPYNMIFLQADFVREVKIMNSWDTTVSTSNLEWLLYQFEDLAAVELNSVPLPPEPPPKVKINWGKVFLNLFWMFILYIIELTNRVLAVLRACPIIIPQFHDNYEPLLVQENEEDWMLYPKSEFDCAILGHTNIVYLSINCTYWSVVNFVHLPRQIKAITLHNPEPSMLDDFGKYILDNPGENNCFNNVEGFIITGKKGAPVTPRVFRTMVRLPKIFMIVLKKIHGDTEEYREILQNSHQFGRIVQHSYTSETDPEPNEGNTYWIVLANCGYDMLEMFDDFLHA